MSIQEIVGVMGEDACVSTDLAQIDRTIAAGRPLRYVTRSFARRRAAEARSEHWSSVARGPTLFLVDRGVRYFAGAGGASRDLAHVDPNRLRQSVSGSLGSIVDEDEYTQLRSNRAKTFSGDEPRRGRQARRAGLLGLGNLACDVLSLESSLQPLGS